MERLSLINFRKSAGLSQEALGDRLGLSKGYISKLESGAEEPSLELALRIQVWSGGEVTAAELRPDLADLIAATLAVAPATEGAAA